MKALVAYREKHRLTREELAQRVGVSTEALRLWELGKRQPRHKKLLVIEAETGLSRQELLPDIYGTPAEAGQGA